MRPTILTFNLNENRLGKLRFICMKLGLAVKAVPAEDCGTTIGALAGVSAPAEAAPADAFPEEMLVFCHMDNAQVNRFLQTAKQLRYAPVALKAILTPANAEWTPAQLCRELKQERAAITQGAAAHEE